MAVVGDSRKEETPIDLAEARRRRRQDSQAREGSTNGAHAPESSASTKPDDRLGGFRFSDLVADDILQHQTEATQVLEEPAEGDEILHALEQTHHTATPAAPKGAPKGSAELEPHQPRQRRAAAHRLTRRVPWPARSRRAAGAAGLVLTLAAAAAAGLTLAASHTSNPDGRPVGSWLNSTTMPLIAGVDASVRAIDRLSKRAAQSPSRRPGSRRARAATHAKAPPGSTSTSAHRDVSGQSYSSPASTTFQPSQTEQSYTPPSTGGREQSRQQQPSSSQPQTTGPFGPGTLGGNCNPKCS